MRATGGLKVRKPKASFFIYGGTKSVKDNIKDGTGWKNGTYSDSPTGNVPSTWTYVTYKISGAEWHKRGYPVKQLYNAIFGIDLEFYDAQSQTKGGLDITWAKVSITYEIPSYSFTFDRVATYSNPYRPELGKQWVLKATFKNGILTLEVPKVEKEKKLPEKKYVEIGE